MNQIELQDSLRRLYGRQGRVVSFVTGPWGVGKTYTVAKVLRRLGAERKDLVFYNLSVFGKSSTGELVESLWLEASKKKMKLGGKPLGPVPKYFRSAIEALKGQFAGAASAIAAFQKAMLDDLLIGQTILVIDDVERKSPNLQLVDLLGFIEMYRERCSIIVVGNTSTLEASEKEIFARYAERLFDQQYILSDVSADVLSSVLSKTTGANISEAHRQSIISSFAKHHDSNMRTLLKTGIVVSEVSQQLSEQDSKDLLGNPDFMPSIVALMIEKHSKGKEISKLSVERSWVSSDDATSAFIKEYSLPTRIGFSLAPFVELIENRRLHLESLKQSLGVPDSDELLSAFHAVVYYWCQSERVFRDAWKRVSDALNTESLSRFSLREIVDFAYASTSVHQILRDLYDLATFETWIAERLRLATKNLDHESLVRQHESVSMGYQALKVKPLVDRLAAIIREEATQRRRLDLKQQFDGYYAGGRYYDAFRLLEDRDFPIGEVLEALDRLTDGSIPDDYFFALKTLLTEGRNAESRKLMFGSLRGIAAGCSDPLIKSRIDSLIAQENSGKT